MSKKTYKQFIEEQNEIYEILGFAARKKKARAMIIMMKKSSTKFKRKLKAMKTNMLRPDAERLGLKAVVNFVKQKIVGKGKDLKDMGVSAKMRVEKLAKKKNEPTKGRTMTGEPATKVDVKPEISYTM